MFGSHHALNFRYCVFARLVTPIDTLAFALLIGSHHPIAESAEDWNRTLPSFEIDLRKDGAVVDHGHSSNVLGGPVSALRHLVDILARDQFNPPLAAGEIVTTGTLTFPVSAGARWTTDSPVWRWTASASV